MTPLSSFFDLHRRRKGPQALLFYVVAFIGTALLSGIVAGVAMLFVPGITSYEQGFAFGAIVGTIAACVSSVLVTGLVVWKKNLLQKPEMLGLIVCAGALGYIGGALLGMIIPSVLTTRPSRVA